MCTFVFLCVLDVGCNAVYSAGISVRRLRWTVRRAYRCVQLCCDVMSYCLVTDRATKAQLTA